MSSGSQRASLCVLWQWALSLERCAMPPKMSSVSLAMYEIRKASSARFSLLLLESWVLFILPVGKREPAGDKEHTLRGDTRATNFEPTAVQGQGVEGRRESNRNLRCQERILDQHSPTCEAHSHSCGGGGGRWRRLCISSKLSGQSPQCWFLGHTLNSEV